MKSFERFTCFASSDPEGGINYSAVRAAAILVAAAVLNMGEEGSPYKVIGKTTCGEDPSALAPNSIVNLRFQIDDGYSCGALMTEADAYVKDFDCNRQLPVVQSIYSQLSR